MIGKLALLAVETVKGDVLVVETSTHATASIREHGIAAQNAGAVTVDGKQVPIVGGVIVHTWANPALVWRFRCDPAKPGKGKA
jgi:hypothetical protein